MSTITRAQPACPSYLPGPTEIYRFTIEQYDQMIGDGSIAEDDSVELLGGVLVRKTPKKPNNPPSRPGWLRNSDVNFPRAGTFARSSSSEFPTTTSLSPTWPWSGERSWTLRCGVLALRTSPWSARSPGRRWTGTGGKSVRPTREAESRSTRSSI
jgi:hypothetical protein